MVIVFINKKNKCVIIIWYVRIFLNDRYKKALEYI
jgi:hypothetical protein